jgi:4-diphosphocytidyl-2-C-methyl-D-erythritol kinase
VTEQTATVLAQGKINLFLRVLAREASGYHQLETLLCRIDLADRVTLTVRDGANALSLSGPALPAEGLGADEQNLAWRAAIAFQGAADWPSAFEISIEKHIPVGGGLGGGSANAGAVLRLLNRMAPRPLRRTQLLKLAGDLGADVPFLTQDVSPLALAWGRGDRLLTLAPLPSRGCVLFVFPFGVPTKEAYQWLADASRPLPPADLCATADLAYWEGIDALSSNDFERVVVPRYQALASAMKALSRVAGPGQMPRLSGSGATIFMMGPSQAHLPFSLLALENEGEDDVLPIATTTSETVSPVEVFD